MRMPNSNSMFYLVCEKNAENIKGKRKRFLVPFFSSVVVWFLGKEKSAIKLNILFQFLGNWEH